MWYYVDFKSETGATESVGFDHKPTEDTIVHHIEWFNEPCRWEWEVTNHRGRVVETGSFTLPPP